jgi:hypothetical protein
VQFLGHVLTPEDIFVNPSKVQNVLRWKSLELVHQICLFLGLASYYQCFIPDFPKIAHPMTKLLQKDAKFVWSSACEEAF